jgi:HAD superfamily hydrolase (TIGR01509 family)
MNYLDGSWAFIFDMDGLMLDSERITNQAWQRASADFGFDMSSDVARECVGTSPPLAEEIYKKHLGQDFPYHEVRKRKVSYFEERIHDEGLPLKAGLLELLDLLESRGIRKAVASSTEQPAVNERLAMTGLLPRFQIVVAGNDVRHLKPAPDLFLEAARRLGVNPARCLVIEDTSFGVFAALSAKIPVILVPDLAPIPADLVSLTVGSFPSLVEVKQFLLDQDLK